MGLFEEIYGRPWHSFTSMLMDDEFKITEFDYEQYIPQEILAKMDTNSDEFIDTVRMMNLTNKTQYE